LSDALAAVVATTRGVTGLEWLAVALALAYLILAIRLSRWCWVCAFASAGLYTVLMYDAALYMESALQLFYMALAVYGWVEWRSGAAGRPQLTVTAWPPAFHLPVCAVIALLAIASGGLLQRFTAAAFPYADSLTTWGAMVATWMTARKVLQSWHYWFCIDALSVFLYWQRDLLLTAALFGIYLLLILLGYRAWRATLDRGLQWQ
jgi:nicotinamide mononucleotide transporter